MDDCYAMTDAPSPSFAFSVEGDAYSTAKKIMGRQAAGEGFLRGLGQTWPKAKLHGVATGRFNRDHTLQTLADGGFTGEVKLSGAPGFYGACATGALYYPTIPNAELARLRNRVSPGAFSLFGVTHTLSTDRAVDAISAMAMIPFQPWDALICTSDVARDVVTDILEQRCDELRSALGATRLPMIQTPIIPLGVDCKKFARSPNGIAAARARLGLAPDEVAFLFAGRLAFHAKANPAEMYHGLQSVSGDAKVVCIEAGLFPNDGIKDAYLKAQQALAPDVRFIYAPGDDPKAYADAWLAADVFVSLSDNVQETFGLTPVEAMAAGLPVVATDWNGYRSNVRHGIDGFLIPTTAAPTQAGDDLDIAVQLEAMTYDRLIGLLSVSVAIDRRLLTAALTALATNAALRDRMGAEATFAWPKVLARYDALGRELSAMRAAAGKLPPQPWPERCNPLKRFRTFPSRVRSDADLVVAAPDATRQLQQAAGLDIANFALREPYLPPQMPAVLLNTLIEMGGEATAKDLLQRSGNGPAGQRALSWLCKFGIVEIRPS